MEEILVRMEEALDHLIDIAENLKDLSQQVVSEAQLAPLQQRQQFFLDQLKQLDVDYQKAKPIDESQVTEISQRIGGKVKQFQTLNAIFIENLKKSHGIVEFEKHQKNQSIT